MPRLSLGRRCWISMAGAKLSEGLGAGAGAAESGRDGFVESAGALFCAPAVAPAIRRTAKNERLRRSEERRVGKECRSRWSPDPERKNRGQGEVVVQDSP